MLSSLNITIVQASITYFNYELYKPCTVSNAISSKQIRVKLDVESQFQ